MDKYLSNLMSNLNFDSFSYALKNHWNFVEAHSLVPRVFLRHTLITKPNEHPGTLRSNLPRKWADLQPLWTYSLLGNTKRQKMPVAIALFLQSIEILTNTLRTLFQSF